MIQYFPSLNSDILDSRWFMFLTFFILLNDGSMKCKLSSQEIETFASCQGVYLQAAVKISLKCFSVNEKLTSLIIPLMEFFTSDKMSDSTLSSLICG